jgi:L,D-transpeptidase ErfK/SrfK
MARPAIPEAAPPFSGPPPVETQEPGAAALLDGEPLQVGLRDLGSPAPAPEPVSAPAPGSVPSPSPSTAPAAPSAAPAGVPTPAVKPAPPSSRRLVLDRRRKVLRVLDGRREVRRFPVAVGMPGWETPVGEFAVIEKRANPTWEHPASGQLLPPGPNNPLGSRWIGFHMDCRGRAGFNGQEHLVVRGCVTAGFHGTPNRGSVGRAVSHGCVRLFDEHAKELFDLVSLGTPVTVLP